MSDTSRASGSAMASTRAVSPASSARHSATSAHGVSAAGMVPTMPRR